MASRISLTYDGGFVSHRELVLPRLHEPRIPATFFIDPVSLVEHSQTWHQARQDGHEIGNGSLVTAALPSGLLPGWNHDMVLGEIVESQEAFLELMGSEPEAFAYPWGLPEVEQGGDYRPIVRPRFMWARSGQEFWNDEQTLDPQYLGCLRVEGTDTQLALTYLDKAVERGAWAILSFAGVGDGELSCDARVHEGVLQHLVTELAVVPVVTISQGVRSLATRENVLRF
ncbi:MAG: polysaccharide deacetylase family protein [Chthonomonas sp.]|nr:polysaccharide deacetylase family protein [Chthonomonas sp.]